MFYLNVQASPIIKSYSADTKHDEIELKQQ